MTAVQTPALARRLAGQRAGREQTRLELHAALAKAKAAVLDPGSPFRAQQHAFMLLARPDTAETKPLAEALISCWVRDMVNADTASKCDQYARLLQVHAFSFWHTTAEQTVAAVEAHGAEIVAELARAAAAGSTLTVSEVRQQATQQMFRPFAEQVAAINFDPLPIERWRNIISGENLGILNELGLVDWLTPELFAEAVMQIGFWGAPYLRLGEFLTGKPGAYLIAHAPDPEQTLTDLRSLLGTREWIGLQAEADLRRLLQLSSRPDVDPDAAAREADR